MKNGSVESLKLRLRCGCTAKVWNKRCTVNFEIRLASAAWRMLQCVPPAGLRDRLRFSKAAICPSSMLRGRPGRNRYSRATQLDLLFRSHLYGGLRASSQHGTCLPQSRPLMLVIYWKVHSVEVQEVHVIELELPASSLQLSAKLTNVQTQSPVLIILRYWKSLAAIRKRANPLD